MKTSHQDRKIDRNNRKQNDHPCILSPVWRRAVPPAFKGRSAKRPELADTERILSRHERDVSSHLEALLD